MKTLELNLENRFIVIIEFENEPNIDFLLLYNQQLKLISKLEDLPEEIAGDFVDYMNFGTSKFPDFGYCDYIGNSYRFNSAIDSFKSLIEYTKYNSTEKKPVYDIEYYDSGQKDFERYESDIKKWEEDIEKSYDPKKSFIFEIK